MDHNSIRHKLSEYLDDAVSPDEKAVIEEHLKTCAACSDALRELRKTIEQVKQIEEVEPPAWMARKIMARVRAEAEEKKSVFHRLFYPLAIKLPIQTVAVLFLAVTAFYIYRSIQPEMKYAEAPMTMPEMKHEAPAQNKMKSAAAGRTEEVRKQPEQAPQKPGYKSLDMRYEYEKPAAPVPQEQPHAPAGAAPAPMKKELARSDKDGAVLDKYAPEPKAKAAAPQVMAEGTAQNTRASNSYAQTSKTTKEIDLQKYIGRLESELSSYGEISRNKSDMGFSMIGKDHVLLTRKVEGTLVLFFAKIISSDKQTAKRDALITDAMIYSASGESRNLVECWCAIGDRADQELMAVVDTSLKLKRLPAMKAWRMNRSTGKFEQIDPTNITCINESFGN